MKQLLSNRKVNIALAMLIGLIIIMIVLEVTGATHFFHSAAVPVNTASEYTKGETADTSNDTGTNQESTSSESGKTSGSTSVKLEQPTGNFVSSHAAHLTSNETSTCNTTPGAVCKITFTMGSTIKSLPAKTTDAGGATYWAWQPDDVGLTPGSWTLKAVAILGNQKLITKDVIILEVR